MWNGNVVTPWRGRVQDIPGWAWRRSATHPVLPVDRAHRYFAVLPSLVTAEPNSLLSFPLPLEEGWGEGSARAWMVALAESAVSVQLIPEPWECADGHPCAGGDHAQCNEYDGTDCSLGFGLYFQSVSLGIAKFAAVREDHMPGTAIHFGMSPEPTDTPLGSRLGRSPSVAYLRARCAVLHWPASIG